MKTSSDYILTTHVGSLPRPDDLIEANRAREANGVIDEAGFQETLRVAVANVVRAQKDVGIDVPGDGEFSKSMGHRVNYGAWWSYAFRRLGGLELGAPGPYGRTPRRSRPGEIVLTNQDDRRDRQRFAAAYGDPESGVSMGPRPTTGPVCVGKLTYIGQQAVAADIANFKAALAAAGIAEGFMTAVAPGTAYRFGNAHYQDDMEFLYDCAEALREEYKAIVDAGLVLQLDDPSTATGVGVNCRAWVGGDEAADAGDSGVRGYAKTTRRAAFLAEMERVVPWSALCARIEPSVRKELDA